MQLAQATPSSFLAPQVPTTANVTVKLDSHTRSRLSAVASNKKRSTHYIMKEAIDRYLVAEEAEQAFIEIGRQALAAYQKDGLHITLDEFSAWAAAIKSDPAAQMPACHV
jgi:predicted transcriptional regulator